MVDLVDRKIGNTMPPAQVMPKTDAQKWLMWLLVAILLLSGATAYWWRDKAAKDEQKKNRAEIAALQQKVSDLEKKPAAEANQDSNASACAPKAPTASVQENIKASITSGNTAALGGYMAPTVKVILAASEGIGDRTPTEAIKDLEYLDDAADPWNFALPAATLSNYGSGDYSQYFPATAVVGKSADDYVISFTFNCDAKISGIFMTADAALL